jgi:hypothetical protein
LEPADSSRNCCWRVTERWWLVAGLRRVGIPDLELFLEIDPVPPRSLEDGPLFTSLLGGNCVELLPGPDSIGAAEPLNGAMEGESGPTLDLGLLS